VNAVRTILGLSSIVLVPAFALQSIAQQPPELPLRDIFFDQGQSILREDAKPVLGESAETLAMNPGIDVEIAGYCNSDEYSLNPGLGQERAEAARSFLISQGINPQRIRLSSECGESSGVNISPDVSEVKLHLDSRVELKPSPQFEPGLL
jgi:outer membrane protein OmpA-like peptidoglycan-associated protein